MCGIAGYQGHFAEGLLERMSCSLAHRGPDGAGTLILEGGGGRADTGFGHRRLSIIDLSANGAQPMSARCPRCGSTGPQGLVLTYNGEIYNFPELRAELKARGHAFHSGTDSEVLLHLYAEHGPEMVSRLNGIFAFALRDGRPAGRPDGVEQGDVLVARDPLGVKPLYLAETERGVLFASEIKALLQSAEVSRALDHEALFQTVAYLWTPAPRTALAGVRKVPPGTALLLRDGAVAREWAYYRLPYGRPHLEGSESEIAAELRERLAAAVDRQMVSDVPVGAFLSGGLDSSAIVAMMRLSGSEVPRCYSIGFRGGTEMEGFAADLPYARRAARHLGAELCEIEIGPEAIGELERMLWLLDEPQADPAPINALLICERARADGIKVLLSGAGGDDIFSGYRRHHALRLERAWAWLPARARGLLALPARALRSGRNPGWMDVPAIRRAAKLFSNAALEGDERLVSYFWWNDVDLRRSLLAPDVAASLAGRTGSEPLLASLEALPAAERDLLNRMLYLETRHFLADHNLNYTDRMGMAAGVEVRVPLLDLDLVEFAARIPPRLKQKGAIGKAIFKKAMEPDLPKDIIYRPKTGFGAPLPAWLRGELRPRVEDTLSEVSLRSRGLFDPPAVRKLLELDRAGRVEGTYTIFSLVCIETWCRLFVDGAVTPPAGTVPPPRVEAQAP